MTIENKKPEKDGEKFWFHLEKETLNKTFTNKKENK